MEEHVFCLLAFALIKPVRQPKMHRVTEATEELKHILKIGVKIS